MALRELNLYLDTERGSLVQGFASTLQTFLPRFPIGDALPISVRALTPNPNDATRPWSEIDLTNQTVRIAIGNPAGKPTSGNYKLTFGANTTATLAFDADAAAIATALNGLTSITSAGGVTVTASTNGSIKIIFNTNGARSLITVDAASLYPSVDPFSAELATGDASTRQIQVIQLEVRPAAFVELTDPLPTAAAQVQVIRAGGTGVGGIQSITFSPEAYDGTFTIAVGGNTSQAITYNATPAEVQSALELVSGVGPGRVIVTGAFPRYTIQFDPILAAVAAVVVGVTGLVVPKGRKGIFSTNTAGIKELLDGAQTAQAKFEVEIFDTVNASAWTVLQADCTVLEDVIGNTPGSSPDFPTYIDSSTFAAGLAGKVDTAIALDGPPLDEGVGYMIGGTIPDAGKGLIIEAPPSGGEPAWSDDGSDVSAGTARKRLSRGIFGFVYSYSVGFDTYTYQADADTYDSPEEVETWIGLDGEIGQPTFTAYDEPAIESTPGQIVEFEERRWSRNSGERSTFAELATIESVTIATGSKADADASNVTENAQEWRSAIQVNELEPAVSMLRRSGAFALNNAANTWMIVPFNAVDIDTLGGALDGGSGRLICKRSGWYILQTGGSLKDVAAAIPRFVIRVQKYNASGFYLGYLLFRERGNYLGYQSLGESITVYLNYNDQLDLSFFKSVSASLDTDDTASYTQPMLSITEISPQLVRPLPRKLAKGVGYGDSQVNGSHCGPENVAGEWLFEDFVNRGVSGRSTADVLAESASIIADADPDAIFWLGVGINDGGQDVDVDIVEIADNIMAIMALASGYKDRVWVTPTVTNYSYYANNAGVNSYTSDLIAEVESRSPDFFILSLANDEILGMSQDPISIPNLKWWSDGLHFTGFAQRRIAELGYQILI